MIKYITPLALTVIIASLGLLLASLFSDHCANDKRFCTDMSASSIRIDISQSLPPEHDALAAPGVLSALSVFAYAFEPLPLSMDQEAQRVFVVPPGMKVEDLATIERQVSADQIVLLGVLKGENERRALVRLTDGRVLQLRQGDKLDEGTVAAISENAVYLLGPDKIPRALVLGG